MLPSACSFIVDGLRTEQNIIKYFSVTERDETEKVLGSRSFDYEVCMVGWLVDFKGAAQHYIPD
jgi:hypothetical protein